MAIQIAYLLNDADLGFYLIEKSRAVLLMDKLNELGAKQLLSGEDIQQLNLLFHEVRLAESHLDREDLSDAENDVSKQWFEAKRSLEKFIRKLEVKYPNYFEYKYTISSPEESELINNILNKDQTYISYFIDFKDTIDSSVYSILINEDTSVFTKTNIPDLEN
jgi:hypothetical protein